MSSIVSVTETWRDGSGDVFTLASCGPMPDDAAETLAQQATRLIQLGNLRRDDEGSLGVTVVPVPETIEVLTAPELLAAALAEPMGDGEGGTAVTDEGSEGMQWLRDHLAVD